MASVNFKTAVLFLSLYSIVACPPCRANEAVDFQPAAVSGGWTGAASRSAIEAETMRVLPDARPEVAPVNPADGLNVGTPLLLPEPSTYGLVLIGGVFMSRKLFRRRGN